MRPASVLVALVASLPCTTLAQEPAATSRQSGPRFYVAGGFELGGWLHYPSLEAYGRTLGPSLEAGYVRQFRRLGVRLGLGYSERRRESFSVAYTPGGCCMKAYYTADTRSIAANASLSFDVTRSRARPYVVGGVAFSRSVSDRRYDDGTRSRFRHFSMAVTPGVGFRFPLRSVEAFTELRFLIFGAPTDVLLPMTFGIRF